MKLDTREVRPNVDEEMCYNFGRKHGVHPLHGHDLVQDFREKLEARDKVPIRPLLVHDKTNSTVKAGLSCS